MSAISYLLLAATAACCFTTLCALPMEGFGSNKCQCVTTTSSVVSAQSFQRIEIVPPGANCRKTEILITKKNNHTVCIDPEALWINKLIVKIMKRKRSAKETAAPTVA
ncbi:growth-regulated alpha protein [Puntigrus tetrazona]|uniref:growth-regulated alpha protein n=1 Tax=Puntigrus tetrazona TaxID=1606681 RepID=UPI001C8ADE0A|nr:growth-regulated alpha protein [Puntigrus tetrazona]